MFDIFFFLVNCLISFLGIYAYGRWKSELYMVNDGTENKGSKLMGQVSRRGGLVVVHLSSQAPSDSALDLSLVLSLQDCVIDGLCQFPWLFQLSLVVLAYGFFYSSVSWFVIMYLDETLHILFGQCVWPIWLQIPFWLGFVHSMNLFLFDQKNNNRERHAGYCFKMND